MYLPCASNSYKTPIRKPSSFFQINLEYLGGYNYRGFRYLMNLSSLYLPCVTRFPCGSKNVTMISRIIFGSSMHRISFILSNASCDNCKFHLNAACPTCNFLSTLLRYMIASHSFFSTLLIFMIFPVLLFL